MKLLAIYFTANDPPQKLIDGSISNVFAYKEQKEERKKETPSEVFFFVNFAEFLRKLFLRTVRVAVSEDVQDETKLLHMAS